MEKLNIAYKEVQIMRDLLIEELRAEFPHLGIELMKLVEMRLQTLLMAGIRKESIALERQNFKG